jgi:hypothetical protein
MVGDKHCLPFHGLAVRDSFTERIFGVACSFLPNMALSGIGSHGHLTPEFEAALEHLGLLREGKATHLSRDPSDLAATFAAWEPALIPLLVLSVGDADFHRSFLRVLSNRADIELPFETGYGSASRAEVVPHQIAEDLARTIVEPLTFAITTLKGIGLETVLVPTLPPPALPDDRFEATSGFPCPLDTRYKATILYNQVLAECCERAGGQPIDTWPFLLDENGYLREDFVSPDGELNQEASLLTLNQIIHGHLGRQVVINPVRYELCYEHRAPVPFFKELPKVGPPAHIPESSHLWVTNLSEATVEAIVASLEYSSTVGNAHARIDWHGNSASPFSDVVRSAEPSQAVLDLLFKELYGPHIVSLMEERTGGDVWYLGCRAYESLPHENEGHGPQAFHEDGTPPHVLRALLYLVDVDEDNGPFEYLASDQSTHRILGPRGTFFVFNANLVGHRATPPRKALRQAMDFVVVPRTTTQPRCVLWPGWNNWPVDPFCFSINKMRSSPPLPGDFLRTNPLPE